MIEALLDDDQWLSGIPYTDADSRKQAIFNEVIRRLQGES